MVQGEQVHISTWPAVRPTSVPHTHTGREKEISEGSSKIEKRKNYDNVPANRTRVAAHFFENKCFGILCTGYLDEPSIATITSESNDPEYIRQVLRAAPRGATMFLDPAGVVLDGHVIDPSSGEKAGKEFLQDEEGILYAELDLEMCIEGKQYHGVVGGYQRLDVFDLKVDRSRRQPATFSE